MKSNGMYYDPSLDCKEMQVGDEVICAHVSLLMNVLRNLSNPCRCLRLLLVGLFGVFGC